MTSRERVRTVLAHREADRVPMDFGSTAVTGMHVTCVAALRKHYGLADHPVVVIEPYQMLGDVEPDLRDALGFDTAAVLPPSNIFGFHNEHWKEWRAPWGQELLVPGDFATTPAPGGGLYIYPGGDTSVPASGHLPATGYFFDSIIRQEPIDEDNLKVEDNLEEFVPFSDADVAHFRKAARSAAATSKAVVATIGGTALGDIALVPAPFLKRPRGPSNACSPFRAIVALIPSAKRPSCIRAARLQAKCATSKRRAQAVHDTILNNRTRVITPLKISCCFAASIIEL